MSLRVEAGLSVYKVIALLKDINKFNTCAHAVYIREIVLFLRKKTLKKALEFKTSCESIDSPSLLRIV